MKALQIGFLLFVAIVYMGLSSVRPDLIWSIRLGAVVVITIFFILTNILRGRPALAANNPLEADETPSLNLTSARMDDSPNKAKHAESASRGDTAQ